MKLLIIIVITFLLSGCGTWKKDTLAYTAGSALVCGAINAAMAPEGDNKAMHFALGGSLCGLAAVSYRIYTQNENEEIDKKQREINSLKMRLGASEREMKVNEGPNSFMESEIPEELKGLVKQQGQWQLFEVDKWEKTKKGFFIHYDKAAKLTPPKFIK